MIFIACSLKDSQNFFAQSLPLYTSGLFSMLLNNDIVDIEKVDGISSFTFVVNYVLRLFLHSSIFSIKNTVTYCWVFRIYQTLWRNAPLTSVYVPWRHEVISTSTRCLCVVGNIMWTPYWRWDNVKCSIGSSS